MKLFACFVMLVTLAGHVQTQAPSTTSEQAPSTGSGQAPAAAKPAAKVMASMVVDWEALVATATRTGQRRDAFDAPTATLDRFHCHITTLNPGENTGPLHRHPQEELVIIKEGTIEVNIDGRKQVAGPGSMFFFAVNENENMTNVGKTPATYVVLQWFTPLTPKG